MDTVKSQLPAYGGQFLYKTLYLPEGGIVRFVRATAAELVIKNHPSFVAGQCSQVLKVVMRNAGATVKHQQGDAFVLSTTSKNTIPDTVSFLNRDKTFLLAQALLAHKVLLPFYLHF